LGEVIRLPRARANTLTTSPPPQVHARTGRRVRFGPLSTPTSTTWRPPTITTGGLFQLTLPAALQPALTAVRGMLRPLSRIEVWRARGLGHSEVLNQGGVIQSTIRPPYVNMVRVQTPDHLTT